MTLSGGFTPSPWGIRPKIQLCYFLTLVNQEMQQQGRLYLSILLKFILNMERWRYYYMHDHHDDAPASSFVNNTSKK